MLAFFANTDVFYHILFVDLVTMPEGPHPIPFRTRSLSLPGPMVLRLKSRESRSSPGLQRGCDYQVCLTLHHEPYSPAQFPLAAKFDAGWSSPVARQAHNLKVIGSNPIPAPKKKPAKSMTWRVLLVWTRTIVSYGRTPARA